MLYMFALQGFENAQIGVTDDKLVYDYDKCVEIFMEREGWEEEEAIEWMEYNVVCQNKAIFVFVTK